MSTIETGRSPVSILYICLVSTADICPVSAADICPVSTCTSKDRKARWRALVNFSMQDCTKREAVSLKLSAAFFWWFLVILNVFVCNMLLQNACKNHQNYVRKTDEHGPKMVPKPLQNRAWRPLGSHPWNKVLPRPHFWWFWLHFGTPFGTSLGSFWASFFWCFFEVPFWRLWPPFGLPKLLQNEIQKGPKTRTRKSSILMTLTHFGHIQGCWKW